MLEWLEQRRIALIAAYRAVLLADGPSMTAAQLDEAVERCVASIVEATPKAVRVQKRLMRRWERLSIDEGIQAGIDAMAQSVADGEHLERMTAFVNRRKV